MMHLEPLSSSSSPVYVHVPSLILNADLTFYLESTCFSFHRFQWLVR